MLSRVSVARPVRFRISRRVNFQRITRHPSKRQDRPKPERAGRTRRRPRSRGSLPDRRAPRIKRSACAATLESCVTMTIVCSVSRGKPTQQRRDLTPVGAVEISGRLGRPEAARASSPTRGRWPRAVARRPTSCWAHGRGDGPRRPSEATSAARRRASALGVPPSSSGNATFSSAVNAGSRLNDWKIKPIRSRRRSVRLVVVHSWPDRRLRARLGRWRAFRRPPRMCSKVLLPEPDGPMIASSSPLRTCRSMPHRAGTAISPSSPYIFFKLRVSSTVHGQFLDDSGWPAQSLPDGRRPLSVVSPRKPRGLPRRVYPNMESRRAMTVTGRGSSPPSRTS